MIYLIPDTHFGHTRMVGLCSRPGNFAERIRENLANLRLQVGDVLIHLGDVSIGTEGKRIAMDVLHGELANVTRILIRGNHDSESMAAYWSQGWSVVCDGLHICQFGKKFILTHEPMLDVPDGYINVHGHLHNSGHHSDLINDGRHILLACEHMDYRAISIERLAAIGATPEWNGAKGFQRFVGVEAKA